MLKCIIGVIGVLLFSTFSATSQNKELPKTIVGGVINGKAISLSKPEYPAAAAAVGASGVVAVQILINEEGNIISAKAISGHPLLRQAAEQAAQSAKFAPTKLSGQPVKVSGIINYNFIPTQTDTRSNEEKLEIMGMGAFLQMSRVSELDDEWQTLGNEFNGRFPKISSEIARLFKSIDKNTGNEKKIEVIDKIISLIKSELKNGEAWQFEFGEIFAAILLEYKILADDPSAALNEAVIKSKLEKMKDLLADAPPEIPSEIREKFEEITKYADRQNLNSEENKMNFGKLIIETLNIISPDSPE